MQCVTLSAFSLIPEGLGKFCSGGETRQSLLSQAPDESYSQYRLWLKNLLLLNINSDKFESTEAGCNPTAGWTEIIRKHGCAEPDAKS